MWATFRPSDFHGTHGSLLSAKFLNSAVVYQASKVAITEIKFHWTAQDIHMPVRLTLAMPQHAIDTLMERYRQGDPELLPFLNALGVLAIVPHDEQALAAWENEGGH
jgi:hypothetical protein